MAKGAATENKLGTLHDQVARVFQKILDRYEARLDVINTADRESMEKELLDELFDENALPSPAMLSAVTKFLKDNDISYDTEEVDKLSSQQRRLQENAKKRGELTTLTTLRAVGD